MAGYCRYKRLKKQVSYDSGATWQDVSPAEYMKGDLIEAYSTICGYAVYTRWVESGYTCVGYDKHAVEYEQTSTDNINWTYTQRSRTGRLIEADSPYCEYAPSPYDGDCSCGGFDISDNSWDITIETIYNLVYSTDGGVCGSNASSGSISKHTSLSSVKKFYIYGGCTGVDSYAFTGCSNLKEVRFACSMNNLGDNIFNSSVLERIIIDADTPPTISSHTFDNTNDCPIYVKCDKVDTYKTAWPTYASRILPMQCS